MPIIAALLTLFACVIGFGVYCLAAIPVWHIASDSLLSRTDKSQRRMVGLIVVPASYMILLFAVYAWLNRPTAVSEMAFGFEPPADVTFRRADRYWLGDYGEESISFIASPATIDRILRKRFETSLGDSTPNADGNFSFLRKGGDGFASETTELTYNRGTMEARYHWVGID